MLEYLGMVDIVECICSVVVDVIKIGDCIMCDFGGSYGIIDFI